MFYNVENFFDVKFDSTKIYNEYTPDGDIRWTNSKYIRKRNSIYKVIQAVGGWKGVGIIGLAEIENETVLLGLIHDTPLNRSNFSYVHYDSPDFRGIDVALLYNTDVFSIIKNEKILITDSENVSLKTRDILYVAGVVGEDTVHVFVNHWTSRYRGFLESEPLRLLAAKKLIEFTDSLFLTNRNANVILMGDFNDNPTNNSIKYIYNSKPSKFHQLQYSSNNKYVNGTMKYQQEWFHFDQIIVSHSLIENNNGVGCDSLVHIFDPDFLLERDGKYLGYKPYRTNIGFKYNGGFSDHLPIFLDLAIK